MLKGRGAVTRSSVEPSAPSVLAHLILGSCFPDDDNAVLKWVQHDLYGSVLYCMFGVCRERYLAAARLIGVETELAERVRERTSLDHRVLQDAHHWIAWHFRYKFDPAGQMPLPYDGLGYKEYLAQQWSDYFPAEVRRLSEHDEFVLGVLTAVGYQNTEPGYRAEDELLAWLKSHYGPMDLRREQALKEQERWTRGQ